MRQTTPSKGRLVIVGANHRSSSLILRDRLFVEDGAVPAFLAELRQTGFAEAVVLSTCDRVEVPAIEDGTPDAPRRIAEVMARYAELSPSDLEGQLYTLWDAEATRHVFSVCASLDSLIVGEPQVLGQVKACHRLARDAGMSGGQLEALLQAAYGAAKRVRTETTIGERPVSISAAAVQIAREVHGDLSRSQGLLVGTGEMGALVAGELVGAGLGHLTVTHPSEARADTVARALDAHVAPFETLAALLADVDIILCAMATRRYVVTADMVTWALRRRRRKPMFLIDAAIPGDIEPSVNRIDEAFLYDLGDLERVAMGGRADREAEADAAWGIVDAEVASFLRGRSERGAVPALTRLRDHFEEMRRSALAVAGDDAEKATRLLVNRLLHAPSQTLREMAARGASAGGEESASGRQWGAVEETLRSLFRLDEPDRADREKGRPGNGDAGEK